MEDWLVSFPYRRDYCLIQGNNSIDVGDSVVDLDFEDLVYGENIGNVDICCVCCACCEGRVEGVEEEGEGKREGGEHCR